MNSKQFEKIFREHFHRLAMNAYTIVHDAEIAKDIVQHVMLKFWEKKDDIVIQTSLTSYLKKAVINTALNYFEKNKKMVYLNAYEEYNTVSEYLHAADKLEKKELKLLIRREIDKLPPKCKAVFSLSRFQGMSNREIAEHLNISLKAVEKHITKALKVLKTTLKPLWEMHLSLMLFLAYLFHI